MKKIFLLLLVSLSLSSCITTQTENKGSFVSKDYTKSMFVISDKVKPGMSKADFISFFGKPYKTDFYFDKDKVLHEDLYYKEQLYIQTWYMINTIFHFENSILISQELGDENRTFSNNECNCSSKK